MLSDYVTIIEAAAVLGVDPGTARRMFDENTLSGFMTPGGHRRVSKEALENARREKISTTVTVLHPGAA